MCLDTGTELTKTDKKPEYGWKVFKKITNGCYRFPCYAHEREYKVPCGRWLTATQNIEYYEHEGQSTYTTGFHVFKTRKGAQEWVNGDSLYKYAFVKVKIKGVRVCGKQDDQVAYIADKMLVPYKAKKKRKK